MNAEDIRDVIAGLDCGGEPVYIGDSTMVVGMDEAGRYWLADNGDEIAELDYDDVLNYCLESLGD